MRAVVVIVRLKWMLHVLQGGAGGCCDYSVQQPGVLPLLVVGLVCCGYSFNTACRADWNTICVPSPELL
jgi:hypothetical protein